MFAIIIGCLKEAGTAYPSRAPEITPGFFGGVRVAHLFSFSMLSYYVFTFLVPCCAVRYNFRLKRCSVRLYLQLFACLIDVICVCLRIVVSNTYCSVFLFCLSPSCVQFVVSFSGLSIFDYPFGILYRLFNTRKQTTEWSTILLI
jgi:hypothetical protein